MASDILTPVEADALALALRIAADLESRGLRLDTSDGGYVAGKADEAKAALVNLLIAAKVFGKSLEAERVLFPDSVEAAS